MLAKKASFWNGTDICMQDGKRETSRIATHMDEIKATINQDFLHILRVIHYSYFYLRELITND